MVLHDTVITTYMEMRNRNPSMENTAKNKKKNKFRIQIMKPEGPGLL